MNTANRDERGPIIESRKLRLLYSKEEIARKVRDLAARISHDYHEKEVVLVCLLKGAFIFLADLVRILRVPLEIDFVRPTSYGPHSRSAGEIKITKDAEISIEGKHVLVVEDITDTGLTLSCLMERLKGENPKSLRSCVLIDKRERRETEIEADYVAFRLQKGFVVGYGLDLGEKYRQLPDIYRIEES